MPDLVVEVRSPGNRPAEIREKLDEYLRAAIPMVWLVDPERCAVAIYRPEEPYPVVLGADAVLEGFPELPGFLCPVAELFA